MSIGTIVDSNVLLDLFTDDARSGDWSAAHLAAAFDEGPVLINPVIYAELSVGFDRIEDLDAALPERDEREDVPWEAAFLTGRCSLRIAAAEVLDVHRYPIPTSPPTRRLPVGPGDGVVRDIG